MSDWLGLLARQVGTRDPKRFVVAVEGDKKEKRYLEPLQRYGVWMKVLPPEGHSSPQAVLQKLNEYRESEDWMPGDELWLMVDTDRWPNLLEIRQEAERSGHNVAISNPCFELWQWLHFFDLDEEKTGTSCGGYKKALGDETGGFNYKNINSHQKWYPQIPEAIRRAKELPGTHSEPVPQLPGTTVYRLMERVIDNKKHNGN